MDCLDIIEKLHEVNDPEIGMNIVDLGLIYNVLLDKENNVTVQLSLTYPGCPLGPTIEEDIRKKLTEIEGLGSVNVEIIWQPPWTQEMIQPDVLEELRFLGRIR